MNGYCIVNNKDKDKDKEGFLKIKFLNLKLPMHMGVP